MAKYLKSKLSTKTIVSDLKSGQRDLLKDRLVID